MTTAHKYEVATEIGHAVAFDDHRLADRHQQVGTHQPRIIATDHHPAIYSCVFAWRDVDDADESFTVYWSDGVRESAEMYETEREAKQAFLEAVKERLDEDLVEEAAAVYTLPATLQLEVSVRDGVSAVTIVPSLGRATLDHWKVNPGTEEGRTEATKAMSFTIEHSDWPPLHDLPERVRWEA